MVNKISIWIKQNKLEALVLAILLLVTLFLRFYNLSGYMTFLGDEGRDALVVQRILVDKDFPLLGPVTSVGNMYLGPLYYYMMSVPMAFFWLNPVAAAAMIALIGTLTVLFIYYLARNWLGFYPAVLASFAYSISPVNIIYSRSSWNPNPAPFFALIAIFGLLKIHRSGNFSWLILTGVACAFALQMHYLAVLLIPTVVIITIYELIQRRKTSKPIEHLFSGILLSKIAFIFLMSPLIIFDFKYNFLNLHAFLNLISQGGSVEFNPLLPIIKILPLYINNLVGRYIAGGNIALSIILAFLIISPIIALIYRLYKKKETNFLVLVLGIWLLVGLLGLSLYRQSIYDHYLGFLNPTAFLLLGASLLLLKKPQQIVGCIILLAIIGVFSFTHSPLLTPPNNQLQRTQAVAKYVIAKANDKPFNFALLAAHNYDSAYQFYLEQYGNKPQVVPINITEQLFVVCEDSECLPINNPKYEIAGFGFARIEDETNFMGVKVFKLVPNPGGKPS